MMNYQHWYLNQDENQVLWLTLDRQDKSANSLNRPILEELDHILTEMTHKTPRAVIILSGKASGFIAGADIEQFTALKDAEEATRLIRQGQEIFAKLENLSCPTVAMIEGFCLGGGFELALACRYRVADDSRKTKMGLPEIMLGIHPGWGGTVRLPRLIGSLKALELILTGRAVDARKAKRLGMIDEVVPVRHLRRAALHYALNSPAPHVAHWWEKLTNHQWLRPLLAKILRKQTAKKVSQQHYPAPYAVIDNWQKEGVESANAYLREAQSIGQLLVSETSRNLVRVFFLQERLKSLGKKVDYKPRHVHVVGGGVMGGDIAAWCALRGLTVTLQDREAKLLAPAIKRANTTFERKLKDPRLVQEAMDRLIPDVAGNGLARADVIIEAIYENLVAKRALFKLIESQAKPDAILATNTSSIPLTEINTVLQQPERLIGIHFFNPVAQMMLVEVVSSQQTRPDITERTIAFVRKLDKLPLPVRSSPGFLVNRILMPYLMEAVYLYNEGVPLVAIDRAAVAFGMPMGPIELADNVGLDVCLAVGDFLSRFYGGSIPETLRNKVAAGELGRKAGKGFYNYQKGKIIKPPMPAGYSAPEDITARLMMRMVNEAAACLREGVVSDRDLLDAGMIFGAGFAPFRGGPMQYSKQQGIEQFRDRLGVLAKQYGDRFKADAVWFEGSIS